MPAKSKAHQKAAAIAKHQPGKLHKRNRGMLSMTKTDLGHFASTKTKGLPKHTRKGKSRAKRKR